MNTIYVLILMLLFTGCVHRSDSHVVLADQQMYAFVKEIYKEKKLHVIGSGGAMMDCISEFALSFAAYDNQRLSVAEARKLIIEIIEKFQQEVNANKKIHPYLSNYPIGPNNIRMSISFYEKPHTRVPEEFVGLIWQINGMIYYGHYDAKEQRFKNDGYEERYEDALRIVKESQALP